MYSVAHNLKYLALAFHNNFEQHNLQHLQRVLTNLLKTNVEHAYMDFNLILSSSHRIAQSKKDKRVTQKLNR